MLRHADDSNSVRAAFRANDICEAIAVFLANGGAGLALAEAFCSTATRTDLGITHEYFFDRQTNPLAPAGPQKIPCKENGRIQHPYALDHSPTTGLQDYIGQNAPMSFGVINPCAVLAVKQW